MNEYKEQPAASDIHVTPDGKFLYGAERKTSMLIGYKRKDVAGALAVPGVDCVVTSEDARRWTQPFAVAVKTGMEQWCLAMDRVRHVGEPVAVVLARNGHTAEDALEQIVIEYRPLPPIVDPEAATRPDAPLLHPAIGSNVVSERVFRYGDPETATTQFDPYRPLGSVGGTSG
jgi:CO/xanthine dehydrogenase Mo-binding subunit